MYFPLRVLSKMALYVKAASFIISQITNDTFSLNEIARNSVDSYETDPKYQSARLLILPISAAILTIPAILVGVTAARNSQIPEENEDECAHKMQHGLLYFIATVYGFAAALCMCYAIDDLNSEPTPVGYLYAASVLVGISFAWGFNQIHSHEIDASGKEEVGHSEQHSHSHSHSHAHSHEDSEQAISHHAKFSYLRFIRNVVRNAIKYPGISFPAIGEVYYVWNELFEQLKRDVTLKEPIEQAKVIIIGVGLVFSLWGLVEANTFAKAKDRADKERARLEEEKKKQEEQQSLLHSDDVPANNSINVTPPKPVGLQDKIFRGLCFFAGGAHGSDHITGDVQIIKDLLFVATCQWVADTDWVDRDTPTMIAVRTTMWVVIFALCIRECAQGFGETLIAARKRYEDYQESLTRIVPLGYGTMTV